VHVVLRVAIRARGVELHFIRRLFVTSGAGELRVCACEREVRFFAVVELPDAPAVRRMATRAVVAEAALVEVIGAMAVGATLARVLIRTRDVALLARNGDV